MSGQGLREWQELALARYLNAASEDFLVTATPGAGKTKFALTAAQALLTERIVEQIIVITPTDHLRHQWAQAAGAEGITIDPTLANGTPTLRRGFRGYAATYAQIAANPGRHRARSSARPTLVILDEIHHAGDGLSWGEAIRFAFASCERRLSLSGTPFRTKHTERIPFVAYHESETELESIADFSYGYSQALTDCVVRPVVFAAYGGESRWLNDLGAVVEASLEGGAQQTQQETERAWRTALDPAGGWVPHVIAAMHDRISEQRQNGVSDAAGLILASDQESARAYAKVVERVTGTTPVLILSDDPTASAKIDRFRDSDELYAVCVRMISEGCDIPRCLSIAYLTNYQTQLFFTQAIGRVVRARNRAEVATVFLPAVHSLLALAATVESERNNVVKIKSARSADPADFDIVDLRPDEPGLPSWEPLSAEARFAHVVHSGKAVLASAVPSPTDADEYLGLPGLLTAEQTALLLSARDESLRRESTGKTIATDQQPPPELNRDQLRRAISDAVTAVATASGQDQRSVHAWLRREVPGPAAASADEAILHKRLEVLRGRLVRRSRI